MHRSRRRLHKCSHKAALWKKPPYFRISGSCILRRRNHRLLHCHCSDHRYLSEKEMQPVYLDCCHSFPVWTLSSLSDSRRGICHRQGRTSGTDLCFPVFLTYPYNRPFLTTGRWCKNVLYPVSGLWNPLRNPGADL